MRYINKVEVKEIPQKKDEYPGISCGRGMYVKPLVILEVVGTEIMQMSMLELMSEIPALIKSTDGETYVETDFSPSDLATYIAKSKFWEKRFDYLTALEKVLQQHVQDFDYVPVPVYSRHVYHDRVSEDWFSLLDLIMQAGIGCLIAYHDVPDYVVQGYRPSEEYPYYDKLIVDVPPELLARIIFKGTNNGYHVELLHSMILRHKV